MSRLKLPALPIVDILGDLLRALERSNRVVLEAPPGAGKTTVVPLALLESGLGSGKILMLEPRRLAARAAAARMATLLNEDVGGTIGYRVRMDTRVGKRTRIEVLTEGILTRMLQDDPLLEGVSTVIFDEFHERSLHTDLAVTLALDAQRGLREDLRILIMSATIAAGDLAVKIGDAEVLRSEGRMFPVEVNYAPGKPGEDLVTHVARGVAAVWNQAGDGDILAFLPGEAEIRKAAERLLTVLPASAAIHPLFGNLPLAEQDRAIRPSADGTRKVVLATSIAETSLTIEGVTCVVDSGLIKRPRWSPDTGFDQLETRRISRASANQRAGRAGRLSPGTCIRLWSPLEQDHLAEFDPPEIEHTDLAGLALEVAAWGEVDHRRLPWPDRPPGHHYEGALRLLKSLGAVDTDHSITPHGRLLSRLPVHPRLGHMMITAPVEQRDMATLIAALVSERDPFSRRSGFPDPDITLRLDALDQGGTGDSRFRQVQEAARQFRRIMTRLDAGSHEASANEMSPGEMLLEAYPDRIALSEGGGTFRMRSGELVSVAEDSRLAGADGLVVAHLTGRPSRRQLRLGAALPRVIIERRFRADIQEFRQTRWDSNTKRVMVSKETRLDALVFAAHAERSDDPAEIAPLMLDIIRSEGLGELPLSPSTDRLLQRAQFARQIAPSIPDTNPDTLIHSLDNWLGPFLAGATSIDDIDVDSALKTYIGWENLRLIDELAPESTRLPSGREASIDYNDCERPVLAIRMQEVYGLTETPTVGRGEIPLTLHLLSPANRPLQITQDLAGFWAGEYAEVRKEMRGRYPKHFWPEDPSAAPAIRGVRPPKDAG